MEKPVLFMLKPGFQDETGGPYFCPDCAMVEGFLGYVPEIANQLDIRRIDFTRPRKAVIELIGVANQSCPVLVLGKIDDLPAGAASSEQTGIAFIAGGVSICTYLGRSFDVVRPHP